MPIKSKYLKTNILSKRFKKRVFQFLLRGQTTISYRGIIKKQFANINHFSASRDAATRVSQFSNAVSVSYPTFARWRCCDQLDE
jgi:hypothetical protein